MLRNNGKIVVGRLQTSSPLPRKCHFSTFEAMNSKEFELKCVEKNNHNSNKPSKLYQ